jgi:hypothetical protein
MLDSDSQQREKRQHLFSYVVPAYTAGTARHHLFVIAMDASPAREDREITK